VQVATRNFHSTCLQGGNLLKRLSLAAAELASRWTHRGCTLLASTFLPRSPTPSIGAGCNPENPDRANRWPSSLGNTFAKSADSAASRMPWLPMLFVWRDFANGFARSTNNQAQDVQPRPRRFVFVRHDPHAGPKERSQSNEHGLGPQRRLRIPHRKRSGNENKRVNWRACDEGLHYWTGREDL
jgi:hypothetical protein